MNEEKFAGAEEWLRESLLAQELLKQSRMNDKTLKALLFYRPGESTFEEMAKKLQIQQPGAFKRWKRGMDSIYRSFYTLELAVYTGIMDAKVAQFLADDLTDYSNLARGVGDMEALRDRIERRMVQITRVLQKGRRTAKARP